MRSRHVRIGTMMLAVLILAMAYAAVKEIWLPKYRTLVIATGLTKAGRSTTIVRVCSPLVGPVSSLPADPSALHEGSYDGRSLSKTNAR